MCVFVSLKLAWKGHNLLPTADLQEFIVFGCLGVFFGGEEGSGGLVCWFFPKPSPSAMPLTVFCLRLLPCQSVCVTASQSVLMAWFWLCWSYG